MLLCALVLKGCKQLMTELCTLMPLAVLSCCILQRQGLHVVLSQWLLYILG